MMVPEKYLEFVILIMNSSIFYFYFRVYGDGRHMNSDIFNSFPIPQFSDIDKFQNEIKNQASVLLSDLRSVFDRNHNRFNTSQIKQTIDGSDKLLCEVYGLDDNSYQYIINYDSEIRNSGGEE
jgi:hypothetical protein